MVCVCVYLSSYRRLKVYAEGGCCLEQYIEGAGWCIDNGDCDAIPALETAIAALEQCKENLKLVA
jgi:hypothetical protein